MPTEQEALLTAAQAAIRTACRKAAARQRRPNPAIDVEPERAAAALVLWVGQDAGHPEAYRNQGALVVPVPGQLQLYVTANGALRRPIDLSLEPTGSVVWTVTNYTVQGQKRTMLLGAVRLENGSWMLLRQIATKRGSSFAFDTDGVWYHNRVKRAKQHARER